MTRHLSKYLIMSKSKNVFVTSDVWFNRPMGEYSGMTNKEYNSMIVENWNDVVSKNDIVYVLGGFGIGNCYDCLLKLNGEIHFLNSVFCQSDSDFRNTMKECVENSINVEFRKRIVFENNQILAIPEVDCVLSYFPLSDWIGKSTDTFCFHGYTDVHNINENKISCKLEIWGDSPISINEIKNNFAKFKKILSK